MEDLVKKLSERRLTTSEVLSITNASVPKTPKKSANLVWVDVAKCLLERVVEHDNANLAHNLHIFIKISVKAEVKSCMSASPKLNRKQCPHISGLLTDIQCLADIDTQPTQYMSELNVDGLKTTLFAAVVDLQVTGVRSRDEKNLVAELYTKLIAMFEQSSEKLCDCLLLCRCLIYKNHRKPRVLIPLLRRVLCSGNNHSSLQYVSGMHYIKLLLLSKIWLLMVDIKEVSVVYSLVAGALKVPEFFSVWLDQNYIPWLRQTDKNLLKVKNILKCMTVSQVLKTLYGANKVNCKILNNIKQETQFHVPQVKKDEMGMKYLVTNIKKKKKKQTLDPSQTGGRSREHETQVQSRDSTRSKGRRIFTPESSKWSTPSDMQQENKVSASMSELQKGRKSSLSKKEFFSHRKRVRQDSLTFTVTKLTEEKIALLKAKEKRIVLPKKIFCIEKVSIGIQTDVSLLNEREGGVKIMKPNTEPPIKPASEINKDCKLLKPILDSPGSYKVLKPKNKLTKENTSEKQDSDIKKVVQSDVTFIQNEIEKSQDVLKPNHSYNQNIDDESDSDIEVMEEILVVNSSSKTPKEVGYNLSDESDIDEASGTEGNIVPCDDRLKIFTDVENQIYHEKLKENEQKRKEAEMEPVVLEMLKKDGKEVQERLKKLSKTEQEGTTPEKTNNIIVNKAEVDGNNILTKLYSNETKTCFSKHNEKETVSDNENIDDNEDIEVVFQTSVSDTGRVERIRNLRERFTNTAEVETKKKNVEPNGNDSEVQIVDEKVVYKENELTLETKFSNNEIVAAICEIYKNMSKNKLKNEIRSVSKTDSKTSDIIIMDSNQELKPKTKKETMDPLKIRSGDSENSGHHKILDRSALNDTIENKSTLIINYIDKGSELIEDNATEKEVYSYIPGAEEELVQSKPSTDNVYTTHKEAKAWLSDQSEVYEASSDASEEHIRAPTHIIRKKMSERKCSAALTNAQITSDSDMSPVRHTQRVRRSSDKSKIHKKINIQTLPVINFGPIDKSMASVSLLYNINDSSFESNFSSTSIVSTDMQMDGSCATVMPAPATTIITNGSVGDKDSMHNSDSDTLESRNNTSMVSENLGDNSKTGLNEDKTVVAETISPDATEDVLEEDTNKEDVEPLRNDAANTSDIFDSATNSKIIENGKDFGKNKVIAKISLDQEELSSGEVVVAQKNAESLLLTKDRVDIKEYEELEVLSKSGVDDDGEKHVSVSPCVTQSKNTLSASSQPASPNSSSSLLLKSTTQCRQTSQTQGKIVGDTEDKSGSPTLAPQSQKLDDQALHKELIVSPSVSCKLNNQSQIKAVVTAPSSTTEDSCKQNLAKKDSKENNEDKNHNKNIMNESLKNKINKADKKNDKLKVGENYDRINYLVQASRMVFKNDKSVSSQLGSLAISFGRRLPQVRLDPLLKREMCKGCGVYLVYGVNAKVRHRSKRQKHLVVTCLTCHTIKRFVTNPNHKLWSEQPEAQL